MHRSRKIMHSINNTRLTQQLLVFATTTPAGPRFDVVCKTNPRESDYYNNYCTTAIGIHYSSRIIMTVMIIFLL